MKAYCADCQSFVHGSYVLHMSTKRHARNVSAITRPIRKWRKPHSLTLAGYGEAWYEQQWINESEAN